MLAPDREGVLWSLSARRSIARCILRAESASTELLILQDDEIAFRESFSSEDTARRRASALYDRLLEKGWKTAG